MASRRGLRVPQPQQQAQKRACFPCRTTDASVIEASKPLRLINVHLQEQQVLQALLAGILTRPQSPGRSQGMSHCPNQPGRKGLQVNRLEASRWTCEVLEDTKNNPEPILRQLRRKSLAYHPGPAIPSGHRRGCRGTQVLCVCPAPWAAPALSPEQSPVFGGK